MIYAVTLILFLSVVLAGIRLMKGPTHSDRVVIFDFLTAVLIACSVLIAIILNDVNIMSLVIVLSVLSFVGTSVLAYFIEKTKEKP